MDAEKQPKSRRKTPIGKPFQKGQSGNPGGRPKGSSITAVIRKMLEKPGAMEEVAKAILAHTKEGNGAYAKILMDRIDGPLREELDVNLNVTKVVIDI
jgi:hypothetical protein